MKNSFLRTKRRPERSPGVACDYVGFSVRGQWRGAAGSKANRPGNTRPLYVDF
jgi:hypothetical protein